MSRKAKKIGLAHKSSPTSPLEYAVYNSRVYIVRGKEDDRFYYLKENETDETWELHVEKIK